MFSNRAPRNTVIAIIVGLIVVINPGQTDLAKREGGAQCGSRSAARRCVVHACAMHRVKLITGVPYLQTIKQLNN